MPYTILTDHELAQIHQSSLRVLWETGILLEDTASRAMLRDHGSQERQGRICIPPDLVESSLSLCPQSVILAGRGGEVRLGDGSLHVHNLGGARDVYDPATHRLRPALTSDVAESTRLMDALEELGVVGEEQGAGRTRQVLVSQDDDPLGDYVQNESNGG